MALQAERDARGPGQPRVGEARNVVLMADAPDGADALGLEEALRPLAELCLSPEAETPFALGLVGGRGVGKRFAQKRLVETVEALAGKGGPGFVSKAVVARIDASAEGGEPARVLAAASFAALEAAGYAQLAEEAGHATVDPRHAAAAAAERHDDVMRRLERERTSRDEVEGRRARIAEVLLYETPGARVDTFVRANRGKIDAKLRRFGFAEGDAGANFRHLVRDLSGLGAASRPAVFLRALWAYRGQTGLIVFALVALALAFGADRLRDPAALDRLNGLSAQLTPVVEALKAHGDWLEYGVEALIVLGFVALFLNLWRAASFTGLLFRGLRLLHIDIRDRRTELDANASRLERRVAALQIEADAARQRAEAMAQRAGGGGPSTRAPAPLFVDGDGAPTRAAREFLRELPRAMSAGTMPAPQRLFLALENLDSALPDRARGLLSTAVQMAGRGVVVIAACDLARLAEAPRDFAERMFQVVFDVGAVGDGDGAALAARLFSGAPAAVASKPAAGGPPALGQPLDDAERAALASVGELVGANPRALKRLYNAYRLARLSDAPRPAVALALAARLSPDPDTAAALRWALFGEGETLEAPSHPPALAAAFRAAIPPTIGKPAAQQAWAVARLYAP